MKLTTSRKCWGSQGRTYSRLLNTVEKDSYDLCMFSRGQQCNMNLRFTHCQDWLIEEWDRVRSYSDRLNEQHERKEERKVRCKSLSCFSRF